MSCYEWERGSIKFSAREWPSFRKDMLTEWKTRQERLYQHATKATSELKKRVKGLRGRERSVALRSGVKTYANRFSLSLSEAAELEDAVLDFNWDNQVYQLARPKFTRQTFGLPCVVSRGTTIRRSDWAMAFSDPERSLFWDVSENNRAVDRARGHDFVNCVFTRLDQTTWTRGTGGVIVGNNEYNRDADYVGGGANYVSASYGPTGDRAAQLRLSPSW